MATVQNLQHSSMSTASSFHSDGHNPGGLGETRGFMEKGGINSESGITNQFPAGLRVLVVDDDPTCLKIIDKMLRRCLYEVTTCSRATVALSMLRERKGSFDLVISDVYMPDMDGFKLLEHVGLEMDLPVIMMSADGKTSVVMKGIKHGACDYLLKPVRIEELKNIWQHIVRKKKNGIKELENSGSVENSEKLKKGSDDAEYASSVNEGTECNSKTSKRRKEPREEEDDFDQDNDDPTSLKKPRVVWSVELHQQFVSAVNQLGIDKAVPKRILEMMNVQGLTRENVASHLQKYRLYLRRLSGVAQQQSGINSSFGGNTEINFGSMGSGRFDLQTLGASSQISPQNLMALQAGLLGKLNAKNGMGIPGEAFCLPASLQGIDSNSLNSLRFGQPLMNSQGNLLQGFSTGFQLKQNNRLHPHIPSFGNVDLPENDTSSGHSLLPRQLATGTVNPGDLGQVCVADNNVGLNLYNNAMMIKLLQQEQLQQQELRQQVQIPAAMPHQSDGQLQGRQILNFPSANLLGQRAVSNPLCAVGSPDSIHGNSLTGPNIEQLNPTSLPEHGYPACTSNAYFGIDQMPVIDYKNHSFHALPGNSMNRLTSNLATSAPLSVQAEVEMSLPGMKNPSGTPELFNTQTLRSSSLNFCASNGLASTINQSNIHGWQVPNFAGNQDLGQIVTPTQSARYSESSSVSQGLNLPGIHCHMQATNVGFARRGLNVSNILPSDAGHTRAANDAACQSEQSTADSGPRFKDSASDLTKHERTKSEEDEFSVDGYQLKGVHVK
ncbi:hypothetical protein SUGI_0013970 [Cryptomeria japonica]|uniref:two-component response regulator ARR2 n=1 Tax=Cryptomeria japonica TaxID=3369 RepID=UPI002408C237|nr:two-component response regulator ARR2 [Cryptomeria japonica]GLJ05219.1 hypothetical protein SUGI_0013970 [Cryptomeria japonica]